MSKSARRRAVVPLAIGGAALVAAGLWAAPAVATSSSGHHHGENEFVQTNLVSNRTDQGAQIVDQNLKNPWGLAMSATSPLWVSDNNAGVATVYSIPAGGMSVKIAPLTVGVPGGRVSTGDGPSPTGQVSNSTTGFTVTTTAGSGPARFIFSSESGQISAWNSTADPIVSGMSTATLEYTSPTAVYKGLTIATSDAGTLLYATNFHDGTVDVFNSSFQPVQTPGGFVDRDIPHNYAPFGIQQLDGLIYVTYAEQNAEKHDDVAGPGHGFIDIFTTDGFKVERLASRGALNSPWGITVAPASFGRFAGQLLVGDFGDGRINGIGRFDGDFLGQLRGESGHAITIDGLWGLTAGTASTGGTSTVLFSAGINGEADGLLGSINAAP